MTLPRWPYLPDNFQFSIFNLQSSIFIVSGVIQANPIMGITAAGTVPDSHRIPLHQAASATRLPYFGGKGTNKQAENQIKAELFLDLSDILLIFANGNDIKPKNK